MMNVVTVNGESLVAKTRGRPVPGREHAVKILFTEEEHLQIRLAAAAAGMAMSRFCEEAILAAVGAGRCPDVPREPPTKPHRKKDDQGGG